MDQNMPALKPLSGIDLSACTIDRSTLQITGCTAALSTLLGRSSAEEVVGQVLIDLLAPDSYADLEASIRGQERTGPLECTLLGADDQEIRVAMAISQRGVASGSRELTLIWIPVQDDRKTIAALEAAVETLTEQNERMSDLSNLANHDLRNLLQTVVSTIDLLELTLKKKGQLDFEPQITRLRRASFTMGHLLDGVMKYLRFEVGEYPMELTNLSDLVDGIAQTAAADEQRFISIIRTCALPSLMCERQLIEELFQNLVGNSIKYTDTPQVQIEIGLCDEPGEHPIFFVRDRGVGIAATDLERVFEPFKRADHRALNSKGTGMGMALVKKIIERHGGRVWIESEVDQGTTVKFSLSELPGAGA
jgi:signal transduction histidine kinase